MPARAQVAVLAAGGERGRNRNCSDGVKEAEVLDFVCNSIGSVWALEVLMLLRRPPRRSWQVAELVRELRSSPAAIEGASQLLASAGLVARAGDHACRYQPASPTLDQIGELVQKLYTTKPATVIGAIFQAPDEKLRKLAAAFKFKE